MCAYLVLTTITDAVTVGCSVGAAVLIIAMLSGVIIHCKKRRQSYLTSSTTADTAVYYNTMAGEQEGEAINLKKAI